MIWGYHHFRKHPYGTIRTLNKAVGTFNLWSENETWKLLKETPVPHLHLPCWSHVTFPDMARDRGEEADETDGIIGACLLLELWFLLLMEEILPPPGMYKTLVNNGTNYLPQRISEPSTISTWKSAIHLEEIPTLIDTAGPVEGDMCNCIIQQKQPSIEVSVIHAKILWSTQSPLFV